MEDVPASVLVVLMSAAEVGRLLTAAALVVTRAPALVDVALILVAALGSQLDVSTLDRLK